MRFRNSEEDVRHISGRGDPSSYWEARLELDCPSLHFGCHDLPGAAHPNVGSGRVGREANARTPTRPQGLGSHQVDQVGQTWILGPVILDL